VVDEQARQRGMDADLSPLGQRVGQIEDRLRKLEPMKVSLDGEEFSSQPEEKRSYDEAIGLMAKGDFIRAGELFSQFLRRHPSSGYTGWVRFWWGQALMGQREYRAAIASFRALVNELPNHPKAPEAMLALASSQVELKDRASARKSLEELLRLYPDSDASKLGRQRLVSMK
jgi:tol-pal system protein YbgF